MPTTVSWALLSTIPARLPVRRFRRGSGLTVSGKISILRRRKDMWDWLKSLWEDPAENFAGAYLAGRDGDPTLAMPIKADQQYFTITLECMHLVLAREAFTKFYGVLSGSVGFDLATGPQAITMIVSPEELKGVDKAQFGRVIVQTVPLCDRVPYIGSAIELRLALLALEE